MNRLQRKIVAVGAAAVAITGLAACGSSGGGGSTIPEPASMALFGMAALGFARRARRAS